MRKLFLLLAAMAVMALTVSAERVIHIHKNEFRLYLIEDGDTIFEAPVCLGENYGQKKRAGDHKTPEGTFKIKSIENSSSWTSNHADSTGRKPHVYGPWFMRLSCPQSTHIGIHGTNKPQSVGTRDSEGCIRLQNERLLELKELVTVGTKVIIYPDSIQ